ncbi:MAG: HNH endonuclease [Candidatus Eiseniibacteriota bacterium]
MRAYALTHLSDEVLLRNLNELVARDRLTTTELLACLAEVDARRLYVPAGYTSMHAFCVDGLHLSDDAAFKRIQAARAARQFPALFGALAEGRLHLTAVRLLAPHLTEENADELIRAASHRRKGEIEEFLARRFPLPEGQSMVQTLRALPSVRALPKVELAPGQVAAAVRGLLGEVAPGQVESREPQPAGELAPGQVGTAVGGPASAPTTAPARYLLRLAIGKTTHDRLRYAQELLSHSVPSGDIEAVLDRALEALIRQLESRKFAATKEVKPKRRANTKPTTSDKSLGAVPMRRESARDRYVPARVKRGVWKRDQGRCTFVGESGHRCEARSFLEFDHIEPLARGGSATREGTRLRCRAHNQFEAERVFGTGFMAHKREQARAGT